MSEGYNDKVTVLLQYVLEKVKNIEISQDRFTVVAEQVSNI